ncbi:transposase family protein [Streptomyces sp. CoH27]|uniref:transposase family protein n=1 Tax=Streptomyces sp. CoH27 TaxID=2875763 RepID=UPI001CD41D62|nr:transposase family protein [Streptomyces sp. CoH27]
MGQRAGRTLRPRPHCSKDHCGTSLRANRPGRRAFVSGKRRQNTIKTTTISDHQGRTLWSGAMRPGRIPDQTCVRTEGIAEQFRLQPNVKAEVDEGYRGLANEFPDQVSAPPRKPKDFDEAPLTERYGWREQRRRQSSRRICVEHANAEHRQWRTLQRYTGRREDYSDTHRDRRSGLRPRRQAGRPAQAEHRTRARPHDGLLNHPPAEPPGRHGLPSIVRQPVNREPQVLCSCEWCFDSTGRRCVSASGGQAGEPVGQESVDLVGAFLLDPVAATVEDVGGYQAW